MFVEAIIDNGRIACAAKRTESDKLKRKLTPSDLKAIGAQIINTMNFIGEKDYEGLNCQIFLRYAHSSKYAPSGFADFKMTVLGD